eukprot:2214922-Pleurochrysis_carterae.AAC.2
MHASTQGRRGQGRRGHARTRRSPRRRPRASPASPCASDERAPPSRAGPEHAIQNGGEQRANRDNKASTAQHVPACDACARQATHSAPRQDAKATAQGVESSIGPWQGLRSQEKRPAEYSMCSPPQT